MSKKNKHSAESNRLGQRVRRYVHVGTNLGSVSVRIASGFLMGNSDIPENQARKITHALGNLKGPIVKIAQFLTTIPEALPPGLAKELASLQDNAPPMNWSFVKRRMKTELGTNWNKKFTSFTKEPVASASLGQVHLATLEDGKKLACKLQYPEMSSAVEADLAQLKVIFSIHDRFRPAVRTPKVFEEISARLREELNYELEAKHMSLYGHIFKSSNDICIPKVETSLSTKRLLTMSWLEGQPMKTFLTASQTEKDMIGRHLFKAWWYPFNHFGVIHGDPHPGNYTIRTNENEQPNGLNLLDFGCIRTFHPSFIQGVIDLYRGLDDENEELIVHAYESWGFHDLSKETIKALNVWAKFIYGPLLDDRIRTIADDVKPGEYGRKEAFHVHKTLREVGPVQVPKEFVFMDRASIGLGGVFLQLMPRLNFHQLFHELTDDFDVATVRKRQEKAFKISGVPLP